MKTQETYKLLVVDDDSAFRGAMRRMIWTFGDTTATEIREAGDGQEAVAILEAEPMDCVLLDNRMPGGEGLDWMGRFLEVSPDVAIVMVTGDGDEEIAVSAMKQGAMDYVAKGRISSEQLERTVSNAIEKVRMRVQLARQHKMLQTAESHRLAVQTLGSACRSIGDPIAKLNFGFDILKRQDTGPAMSKVVNDCGDALDTVTGLVEKLARICSQSKKPYVQQMTSESALQDAAEVAA